MYISLLNILQTNKNSPICIKVGKVIYTVKVRSRFKGLHLIDRVPDELWTEVRDIVQQTGTKTIPMEKKCKKAKWLSGGALQIAVKRREENERYAHLNSEFQRIARRD